MMSDGRMDLEYEVRFVPFGPVAEVVRATKAAGWFAVLCWVSFVSWYGLLWGAGHGGFWWVLVPCALWLIGGMCEVAALLEAPTWWVTKVVGWVLAVEGLVVAGVMVVAYVRLAYQLSGAWIYLI